MSTLVSGYGSGGNDKDCINQDINKADFQLFGQNNVMYDHNTSLIDVQQRLGPGRYKLDNIYDAFNLASSGEGIKIVIKP